MVAKSRKVDKRGTCNFCNGTGRIQFSTFTMVEKCNMCRGTGKVRSHTCKLSRHGSFYCIICGKDFRGEIR